MIIIFFLLIDGKVISHCSSNTHDFLYPAIPPYYGNGREILLYKTAKFKPIRVTVSSRRNSFVQIALFCWFWIIKYNDSLSFVDFLNIKFRTLTLYLVSMSFICFVLSYLIGWRLKLIGWNGKKLMLALTCCFKILNILFFYIRLFDIEVIK